MAATMGRGGGETAGFGSRSFVSKEEDSEQFWLRPSLAEQHADDMIDAVRVGLVGAYRRIDSPFGTKRIVYCDWSASGRPLSFGAYTSDHPTDHSSVDS